MPDYREIYNDIVTHDQRYNLAENSPGLRAVIEAGDRLSMLSGRMLDIGCGVGFALEYLSGPTFDFVTFGVDASDLAIEKAKQRLAKFPGSVQRLMALEDQNLPFEDDFFSLITCFDVLEHLDEHDIDLTLDEIQRVVRKGGVILLSVSNRTSGVDDKFGDNLHRTVKSVDWWIDKFSPDHAQYDGHRQQLTMWKHIRLTTPRPARTQASANANLKNHPKENRVVLNSESNQELDGHPRESASLYQKIYDDNPWYGDAEQDRCPGVRLLPEYQEWLLSPVMDLGCGRGQTVEKLRELGMEADGIDQISVNPAMRVGDITKPIDGMSRFNSAVCVDCIEHLYDDQVLGLFENLKQVKRQAFSIHNGESTGTGQELHVNRKDFVDWTKLVREHFDIATAIQITDDQILYLTQSKQK